MTEQIIDSIHGYSDLTLHIVLATVPQRREDIFNDRIITDFYGQYRLNSQEYQNVKDPAHWSAADNAELPVLYNPLRYHILGNYDSAYIALIDNFKFVQRVFEPQLSEDDKLKIGLFAPHTFQSFSGITYSDKDTLKAFFADKLSKKNRKYFIGITNLKLNNGFLVGNGRDYLKSVIHLVQDNINKLNEEIKVKNDKSDFLILQSFSWFELSLVFFTNSPEQMSLLIKTLRGSSVKDLANYEDLIKNSLYADVFDKSPDKEMIENANVFADTHTYFGMDADLIDLPLNDPYVKKFYKKKIKLRTETEWQVKPGHMHLLLPLLKKKVNQVFNFDERYLLAGKNDYIIKNSSTEATHNVDLFRLAYHPDKELYQHVRKIKTRVYFQDVPTKKVEEERNVLDLNMELVRLGVKICDFTELDTKLKSLKISRQIRSKILKIFSNYNNGIQDIILFPFFLDFKIFIDHLIKIIDAHADKLKAKFYDPRLYDPELNVSDLEHTLMNLINIFQEGFNIRMLNGYQFEDINDFDLDFNSSIQQLLSVYSTLAIEMGNLFYKDKYEYGPVVQLNLKDTVSSYMSINYYVHHLTSPEFIFATLTKEILNFLHIDDPILEVLVHKCKKAFNQYNPENAILGDLQENGLVNIHYLINDALRFVISYNLDFSLYNHWFWAYNLQNASLYDETGIFNEDRFRVELFRILFIHYFFGIQFINISCPLPELYTYWDRHITGMDKAVQEFCAFLKKHEDKFSQQIMDYMLSKLQLSIKLNQEEFDISDQGIIPGGQFVRKMESRYKFGAFVDESVLKSISKRVKIYEFLDNGDADNLVPTDSLAYIQWYMLNYLKQICELNDNKTVLLRRNWSNGMPLKSFLLNRDFNNLYAIDQTGGLFFYNTNSLSTYFQLSAKVLCDIWDFSLRRKKKFMKNIF